MKRVAALAVLTGTMLVAAAVPGTAFGAALVEVGDEGDWSTELIYATAPPDDPRLFVVERGNDSAPGAIRVVEGGVVRPAPFLSIPNVTNFSERGVQSVAFSPGYATDGLLYVFYTAAGPDALDPSGQPGDVRVVEYRRSPDDPNLADPSSARLVLKVPHTAGNHNGGQLAFGPDGMLYVTVGENAAPANAQTLANLLGKVLRIDPADPDGAGGAGYSVPPDNPFVGVPGARPEIWTWGLRNPFRASFAPDGDLVVADVGGGTWEEVNKGTLGGLNLGWSVCEGFCSPPQPQYADPFFAYPHVVDGVPVNCAVLGGYVVRDPDLTGLTGKYLYGDLCASDLRTLNFGVPGGDPGQAGLEIPSTVALRSFGQDAGGCVYVVGDAGVFRVAPAAGSPAACPRSSLPGPPAYPPPDPGGPGPGPGPGSSGRDTAAPKVTLRPITRRLRRVMRVRASCSEACELRALGTVTIRRGRERKPITGGIAAVNRRLGAARSVRIGLKLRKRLFRKAKRSLSHGRRVVVRIKAGGTDAAGNAGADSARLVIRPR